MSLYYANSMPLVGSVYTFIELITYSEVIRRPRTNRLTQQWAGGDNCRANRVFGSGDQFLNTRLGKHQPGGSP